MDPTSPIRTHHSPERSEGELPASFFDKLGEFQEFSHTREFKTDPFATPFSHGLNRTKPQPLFKDELYFEPNVVRVERTRASSLSMPALLTFPQSSVSSAFGPATFASGWNVPTDPKLLNSQEDPFNIITVEEPEDSNALARTIDALGLDDPVNSPIHSPTLNTQNLNTSNTSNRVRSISVSFPQDTAGDNIPMVGTFGRPLSALELTSSFTPTKKHSEEESWDQVTERVSVHVNSPSKESASGIDRSMTESPLHEFMAPSRSLWIGNIDSTFGSDELFQIFSRFGVIESIRMLPEKECAFVNYIRLEDALSAREQMQGGRIGSCIVRIGFGKTDAIHDNQGMQPTKSLWVGNILPTTKPADLELIFSRFGTVESARVLTHKNCGFVNFINLEDAMTARSELNGQEIGGSIVKIGFAKVPSRPEPPLSVAQALNSPLAIAGLAAAAIERSFYPSGASNYQSYGGNGAWGNPQSHMGLGSPIRNQREDLLGNSDGDIYAPGIIQIPESNPCRKIDQNRLRDIRKRLESHITTRDLEMIFAEVIDDAVDLCSDYIGNVVIQKIMEKCSDVLRLRLIEAVSPRMASLGIHKNGTWAVQKIIDCAKTAPQIEAIVTTLKVYAPALLLDQYGNYVIQCCLRLGTHRNQFIFDAMAAKCWELGQGRFGARAMKACLESQFTSKEQQKQVAVAIAQNCVQLCMNSNGSILITWLTDMSGILIRYRMLAPLLLQHLSSICSHKLASTTVLKIVNQRVDVEARDIIVKGIFESENVLHQILLDQTVGVSLIQKILASGCTSLEERSGYVSVIQRVLSHIRSSSENQIGYKRLIEELTCPIHQVSYDGNFVEEVESPEPLESEPYQHHYNSPTHPTFANKAHESSPLPPKYPHQKNVDNGYSYQHALPTPIQSPTYYAHSYYPQSYGYSQPYYSSTNSFTANSSPFNNYQQSAGSAESHYQT